MGVLVDDAELREQMMQNNEEYRRLAAEHRDYAEQIDKLSSRHYLTEEEKIQEVTLKKKKLMLKDQMYSLMQKYRKQMQAGS